MFQCMGKIFCVEVLFDPHPPLSHCLSQHGNRCSIKKIVVSDFIPHARQKKYFFEEDECMISDRSILWYNY